ncbi:hypothetical protein HMPREF3213_03643 [Heyndrickxia coagulans]|uniref:Uncharacterized protein n=1 Tax=Heyndrickxia coagulans TaxID=1398 RepID=A0A133KBB9_HEYCO|nr:hypothetical protein HMPREF3213_03643 [Heyndrickxia coagulans]
MISPEACNQNAYREPEKNKFVPVGRTFFVGETREMRQLADGRYAVQLLKSNQMKF